MSPQSKARKRIYDTKYDYNRRQRDPFFAVSKRMRSTLSSGIRRYIDSGGKAKCALMEAYLGCSFKEFMCSTEQQAKALGFELADYGRTWELDHIAPLCAMADAAEAEGIEPTMLRAFNRNNLAASSIADNRNHALKPAVAQRIGRKRKAILSV